MREKVEDLLVKAHLEAKAAWDAGAKETEMEKILTLIRHAQWRWDFAAAGHGNAFHAPIETMRILGTSIEKVQEARLLLTKLLAFKGVKNVYYPDISTKAKAQNYIGLDIEKLKKEKQEFLNSVVPNWVKKAKEREAKYTLQNI